MRRRLGLLAFCVLTAFAAAPAWACFGPYAHQLLSEAPENLLTGATAIRVDFTNQGAAFEEWQRRMPILLTSLPEGRPLRHRLVGIARRIDGHSDGAFPVYARVTSCTPDFDLDPSERPTRHTYLVGRFQQADGQRIFVALAREADGEWEPLVDE
jgi:hypothetical protein